MERSPGPGAEHGYRDQPERRWGKSTSPTPSRSQSRPVTGSSCPCAKFVDVDTSRWYHEGLDYVVEYEIMNGITENCFAPNENITRGMVMTILYRMASSPEVTEEAPTQMLQKTVISPRQWPGQQSRDCNGLSRWYLPPKSAGHPAGAGDLLLAVRKSCRLRYDHFSGSQPG